MTPPHPGNRQGEKGKSWSRASTTISGLVPTFFIFSPSTHFQANGPRPPHGVCAFSITYQKSRSPTTWTLFPHRVSWGPTGLAIFNPLFCPIINPVPSNRPMPSMVQRCHHTGYSVSSLHQSATSGAWLRWPFLWHRVGLDFEQLCLHIQRIASTVSL